MSIYQTPPPPPRGLPALDAHQQTELDAQEALCARLDAQLRDHESQLRDHEQSIASAQVQIDRQLLVAARLQSEIAMLRALRRFAGELAS